MIIATCVLTLRRPKGNIEIPIRIFAPIPEDIDWSCRLEIDWPDGTRRMDVGGVDAVQAIELAMNAIGHKSTRVITTNSET